MPRAFLFPYSIVTIIALCVSRAEGFNYTITDDAIDLYVVDTLSTGSECSEAVAKNGRYPVTAGDANTSISLVRAYRLAANRSGD